MTETEHRAAVIAEARSWMGTPYRKMARKKGAGCDCYTFIEEVYRAQGLISGPPDQQYYGADWFRQVKEEYYLLRLSRHAKLVLQGMGYREMGASKPAPGNIVVTRALRSERYNHGGIVVAWPRLLHAVSPAVEECDASGHYLWAGQPLVIFDPWQKGEASQVRGLGDVVAKATKAVGIKPCAGCEKRQGKMNQWFPFRRHLR